MTQWMDPRTLGGGCRRRTRWGRNSAFLARGWEWRWRLLDREDKALFVRTPHLLTWLVPSQEGPTPEPSISGNFSAIRAVPRPPPSAPCLSLILRSPFVSSHLGSRPQLSPSPSLPPTHGISGPAATQPSVTSQPANLDWASDTLGGGREGKNHQVLSSYWSRCSSRHSARCIAALSLMAALGFEPTSGWLQSQCSLRKRRELYCPRALNTEAAPCSFISIISSSLLPSHLAINSILPFLEILSP